MKKTHAFKWVYTLLRILSLAALAWLVYFRQDVFDGLSTDLPLGRWLDQLAYFLIFALTANLVVSALTWFYRRRKKIKPNRKDNVVQGLENIYYLVLAGGVIITILGFFGIDLQTLFTSLSIVAAAIAIISKDFLSEIISGIIISFTKDVTIDDYVKIGEHRGKIMDINIHKIALLDDNDDLIYIPNNKFFSSEVINFTKRPIKRVSIEFEMDIRFIKTIEELENDLIDVLSDYHEHITPGSFYLRIEEVKKDYLVLKFQYTLQHLNRELQREIRKKTVRRVINYVGGTKEV